MSKPDYSAVLREMIERFRSGDIPEAIALSMFPIPNIPAAKWSLLNRTLMFLAGTEDARGYRQWQEAGRQVNKGAKSFRIFAPRFCKVAKEESKKESVKLIGFLLVPVFRVQDTDGEPLDYVPPKVPDLPLVEVATAWGVSVKAIPGNYQYYGYYSGRRREIALASPEECVFFHELTHAAHDRITPLKPGQDWKQEVVAELGAAVLCRLVGKKGENMGQHYRYIDQYAVKARKGVPQACLEVFSDVEKVLSLILKGGQAEAPANLVS
ncbi:MAG: antirestriction protein [Deltaproteobacteria bacterium]|nr:MAG: antirestriction protein [Deltaproteobacteria bacterium]